MTTTLTRPTCTIKGCTRNRKAKGLCNNHYQQLRRAGRVTAPEKDTHCSVDGCTNTRTARGYCLGHYTNWKRTGNPEHAPVQQLSRDELVYLRRLVGLPDTGPTAEQIARWRAEETADGLGVAS
ncbi:hypothetical protein [Amycolatopsis taiwanensis]|uniref:hypothetical protein n=1 Tax=Amycolatopsis taiwanensis TaxID=342230 RepID=UPI0004860B61|nr:hypothetical protein [Amycolatopsis taiwanensis]